jgi:hypothetical protein
MHRDQSLPPPLIERQLALPLETRTAPAVLVGLGPIIPPRKVWRSLTATTQAAVRQGIRRVCLEVVDDPAAER